jgi:hypothetical protein
MRDPKQPTILELTGPMDIELSKSSSSSSSSSDTEMNENIGDTVDTLPGITFEEAPITKEIRDNNLDHNPEQTNIDIVMDVYISYSWRHGRATKTREGINGTEYLIKGHRMNRWFKCNKTRLCACRHIDENGNPKQHQRRSTRVQ